MQRILITTALACLMATSAEAQFKGLGGLGNAINKGTQQAEKAQAVAKDLTIDEQDEIKIGELISEKVRAKYGVAQDPQVHKYVALVGTVLAKKSSRPNLPWQFIVLDTDGVNAFAAPGGYIHITRGALALMKSEAELAGVLGHEISHVTRKHTVNVMQKDKSISFGANKTGADKNALYKLFADKGFELVFAGFGRGEELEADADGIPLVAKAGYSPGGLTLFLFSLQARNKDSDQKQGLFASHPELNERLEKLTAALAQDKSGASATLEARYTTNVKYQAVPLGAVAQTEPGAAQPAAAAAPPAEEKKEEKKSRFGLSGITNLAGGNNNKQSASVTGSAASRGVDRERGAKGGSNPNKVAVTITDADLATFIKDGKLTA